MNIMSDIIVKEKISEFSCGCFDSYVEKIKDIDVKNITLFPMSTSGKKIFYNTMFVKIFSNNSTVSDKKSEIDKLYKKV